MDVLRTAGQRAQAARAQPSPVPAGATTAAGSSLLLLLPSLLVWVASPESTVSWTNALSTGAALWLLAGGAHLEVGTAVVSLVPLALLALVLWLAVGGARRVVVEDGEAGRRVQARALLAWCGGYAGVAALAALLTLTGPVRPTPASLVIPVVGVPAVAAAVAGWRALGLRAVVKARLPLVVRRGLRPGLEGAALLLGLGALLVVAVVALRIGSVTSVQAELAPGVVGGVALALAQLAVLPNLALWALSFAAGPGFSVVSGVSTTWSGSESGLLPLVPVLAALPQPGGFPPAVRLLVLAPVLVGAVVAWRSVRSMARLATLRSKAQVTASAVTVAAVLPGLADLAGGGSLGSDRLASVGVPAVLLTSTLFIELGIGAVVVLVLDALRIRR